MAVDQDWTAVYPTAASFKADAVPLPVRMGYPIKRGVPPEKKGNLELIKVRVTQSCSITGLCFLSWKAALRVVFCTVHLNCPVVLFKKFDISFLMFAQMSPAVSKLIILHSAEGAVLFYCQKSVQIY